MTPEERFEIAAYVSQEWNDFQEFAEAGMQFLGYAITWEQSDIAMYMQHGPRLRMVMAQRGEAKTTLAALYAVWRIIQDPQTIVLIVSGGESQASDIANLIVRLIMTWDLLEYLRPDTSAGDRRSGVSFDVHWMLKGINKSPSVSCAGVTSSLQGKRAHLLIPDDVETTKNSLTAAQRGILLRLTQEFTSINADGDILYLGTPQTKDSIYNTLERRGFELRIWPGRYPNVTEIDKYADRLAPSLAARLLEDPLLGSGGGLDGTRGKPTDPARFNESALQEKELDQGPEGFQLQYMLDTSLIDAARQQLRLSDIVVANFDPDMLPEVLVYHKAPAFRVQLPKDFPVYDAEVYHPAPVQGCRYFPRGQTVMCLDPAGGGGDEIGFSIGCAQGSYVHALDNGGLRGGLTRENGDYLIDRAVDLGVTVMNVESNMGHGLFEENLKGILAERKITHISVVGFYSTGQKERRIIDSIVGALQRHRLVLHQRVFDTDAALLKQHSAEKRKNYSLFYQLANITTDRNSLVHDDRLEALAMLCRFFKQVLAKDDAAEAAARNQAEQAAFMRDPMGLGSMVSPQRIGGIRKLLAQRARKRI